MKAKGTGNGKGEMRLEKVKGPQAGGLVTSRAWRVD